MTEASEYIRKLKTGRLDTMSDAEVWTTRSRPRLRAEIMYLKYLLNTSEDWAGEKYD